MLLQRLYLLLLSFIIRNHLIDTIQQFLVILHLSQFCHQPITLIFNSIQCILRHLHVVNNIPLHIFFVFL